VNVKGMVCFGVQTPLQFYL